MAMMKKFALISALILLCVSAAVAGRPVDESRKATSDGEVAVELLSGTVKFIGSGGNEVRVSGTLGDDVEELKIESHGDRILIEVVLAIIFV